MQNKNKVEKAYRGDREKGIFRYNHSKLLFIERLAVWYRQPEEDALDKKMYVLLVWLKITVMMRWCLNNI